jgi:regulator of vacuolar morphogenesis
MAPPAEISIPSTILSKTESKPFTLYNITLRLPLRSFVVQKRYSDFATLHSALTTHVGAAPPAPLPGKSWFKSTVSSAELTENRRLGLEAYMRAIAESPDRRWRDTSAWRAFLNLPSSSAPNSALSAKGMVGNSGVGVSDPSAWLEIHREMKACLHEARLALARRDGATDTNNTTAAAEAGAAAKRSLVKGGTLVSTLTEGLRAMQEAGRLGDGEIRRRRDLLSAARVEREGLDKLSNTFGSTAQGNGRGQVGGVGSGLVSDKATLLSGASSSSGGARTGRVLGAPLPETERTRELDNTGVLLLQKEQMADQDQAVEQLGAIVRRQKEMGLMIRDEVDAQNEMLDRMHDDVDRVHGKIKVAKNRVKNL